MQALSLKELNQQIQQVLHGAFDEMYWITAEISELKENRNGHCYLELVEKDGKQDKILAKMRAIVWANIYRLLKAHFNSETGHELDAGLNVMIKVSVSFHPLYGLSLQVADIDPTYTLGDIARRKQEILQQLDDEGVLNMNKEIELPLVPQRIAVISSETAAGFQDFCNQLNGNPYGYQVHYTLFHAVMQGDSTESSVIQALDKIHESLERFDAVAIIRGGGSRSDLSYFDSHEIALNIAQFPLPVVTGIGHEKDESIADLVAHTHLKTPTAVAEFLLEQFSTFEAEMQDAANRIIQYARQMLIARQEMLAGILYRISAASQSLINEAGRNLNNRRNQVMLAARNRIQTNANALSKAHQQMIRAVQQRFIKEENQLEQLPWFTRKAGEKTLTREQHRLELLLSRTEAHDPSEVLKKGYTITTHQGKIVRSAHSLQTDDLLETHFADGTAASVVSNTS